MRNTRAANTTCLALVLALVGTERANGAGAGPLPVSPGESWNVTVNEACPTFSWGLVEKADHYELAVYAVEGGEQEPKPLFRRRFPGSVGSWTPSVESCLDRGGRYAWLLRAQVDGVSSDWSQPLFFAVAPGPTRSDFESALAVVRSYLESEVSTITEPSPIEAGEPPPDTVPETTAEGESPPPGTQLSVDGNVAATSFSGDGALLTGVDALTFAGLSASNFSTDAELLSHQQDASAHHVPYTDGDAISAMGPQGNDNPLNHQPFCARFCTFCCDLDQEKRLEACDAALDECLLDCPDELCIDCHQSHQACITISNLAYSFCTGAC